MKRNLRKEMPEYWHAVAQAEGTIIHHDEANTVYTGIHIENKPAGDEFFPAIDILKLALLSFNLLRFIGQTALIFSANLPYKTTSKRKRLRKVRDYLIRISVKIVRHARQTFIRLWDKDPWLPCFRQIYVVCCML